MGIAVALLAVALCLIIVALRRRRSDSPPQSTDVAATSGPAGPTLKQRIENLAAVGLMPLPPSSAAEVATRAEYVAAQPGYWPAVYALAVPHLDADTDEELTFSSCPRLWCFDTECIEDDGTYSRMITNLGQLTGGVLWITDAEDQITGWPSSVDEAGGVEVTEPLKVQLSCKCNGQLQKLEFDQHVDYFEPIVMEHLEQLLAATNPDMKYFAVEPDGQQTIIGCLPGAQLEAFKRLTSLPVFTAAQGIRLAVGLGLEAEEIVFESLNSGQQK